MRFVPHDKASSHGEKENNRIKREEKGERREERGKRKEERGKRKEEKAVEGQGTPPPVSEQMFVGAELYKVV